MRILVVDDDEMTCLGLQKWIGEMMFSDIPNVDTAFSAEEAIALLHKNRVNILITDIQMVDMNGLDLIMAAKEYYPDIVSIIITAYSNFPYAYRAIQLGIRSFLVKPFDKEEMRSALLDSISAIKKDVVEKAQESESINPITWAMAYVYEHLNEEIDMAVIANKLNLSYSYFSTLFRKERGKSFLSFVGETKMQEAVKLLQQNISIREIAERLGYGAQQNFSRAFKNYWGCTPNGYRKKERGIW